VHKDWVPLSASALVVGVMSLVFGALLNPSTGGETAARTLDLVRLDSGRWLAMAVMYFFASVALTLGLPAVLTLLVRRGRGIGLVGLGLFTIGSVGTCGFAMVLVFYRALVLMGAIRPALLEGVATETGLRWFLIVWIGGFYGGVLAISIALFLARTTARWIPALLLLFVVMAPFTGYLGRAWSTAQLFALAVGCTGIAIAAVGGSTRVVAEEPVL
jgi:hypothetical protein